LYLPFKTTRGHHFLAPLLRYLAGRGAGGLRVLEVGCSFGHNTEYLNDQSLVAEIHSFDVDPAFVEMTRAKVDELQLGKVRQWLPARLAFGYARLLRPRFRGATFENFDRHGAWRNASLRECLPSAGAGELVDVTEEAGYGWRFFRATARSRTRRALLPMFALV